MAYIDSIIYIYAIFVKKKYIYIYTYIRIQIYIYIYVPVVLEKKDGNTGGTLVLSLAAVDARPIGCF